MKLTSRRVLTPDFPKIQEAILYLLSQRAGLTQYQIVKALFLADRRHLNDYGRPITFDNYVALEHGPVPSAAYEALKPEHNHMARFGEARPWTSTPERPGSRVNNFVRLRAPREAVLSATDIEALDEALTVVVSLSFGQLRRLTHEDPAYVEAWDRRGAMQAADMELARLFDEDDDERASELAYISAQA